MFSISVRISVKYQYQYPYQYMAPHVCVSILAEGTRLFHAAARQIRQHDLVARWATYINEEHKGLTRTTTEELVQDTLDI